MSFPAQRSTSDWHAFTISGIPVSFAPTFVFWALLSISTD